MTDFYELLFKELSIEDDIAKDASNVQTECLISFEPLEENNIELDCYHKFNYDAIFNELYKQKYSKSRYEVQSLKLYQVKCPYCRKITNGILPSRIGYQNINYVNYPIKYQINPDRCKHVFKYGKRKGLHCHKKCNGDFCKQHLIKHTLSLKNISLNNTVPSDDTPEPKANSPSAGYWTIPTPTLATKLKSHDNTSIIYCSEILKTGKRKGQPCGATSKTLSGKCGRHNT